MPKLPKNTLGSEQYIADDLLFLLWRITKTDYKNPRLFEFAFEYLRPPLWSSEQVMRNLLPLAKQFGITLQNPRFEDSYFKDSFPDDYKKIVEYTQRQETEKESTYIGNSEHACKRAKRKQ